MLARRGCTRAAAASGASRDRSWSGPARLESPSKASRWRCLPTVTPRSWADSTTTRAAGAAWVFTRSGGVWSQQGSKLVGTGAVGSGRARFIGGAVERWQHRHRRRRLLTTRVLARPGCSRAAAASGASRDRSWSGPARSEAPIRASRWRFLPTAIPQLWADRQDHSGAGAAWVFTRSGGVWSQQGSKLVGTGAVGFAAARLFRGAFRRRQHRRRRRNCRQFICRRRVGLLPARKVQQIRHPRLQWRRHERHRLA